MHFNNNYDLGYYLDFKNQTNDFTPVANHYSTRMLSFLNPRVFDSGLELFE